MNAPPRLWTGEAVLDHALEVAGFTPDDLRRSMEVTREALDAETPTVTRYDRHGSVRETIDGGPDHPVRLRASENIFGWLGLRGSRALKESASPQNNLVVMWVQAPPPSSSPTPLAPSKPSSTLSSPPNTRASVSWSATDDSAKA